MPVSLALALGGAAMAVYALSGGGDEHARVAAEARPDEILVSRTVKDLALGSTLSFLERGERHELKGVPGEWQLYAAA